MKAVLLALVLFTGYNLNAQAPGWEWARSGVNTSRSTGRAVASDPGGSIYVTGQYTGSLTFGNTTLDSEGTNSIYIVKYNATGSLVWAASLYTRNGTIIANSIAADTNGDVYLSGEFTGTIIFGKDSIASKGMQDIFLAKFHADGSFGWGSAHGTKWDDNLPGNISLNSKHEILIAGGFCGVGGSPPEHESIEFGNYTLTSQGNEDIFLARFDSSGEALWAKGIGSRRTERAFSLAITKSDKILVVGAFESSLPISGIPTLVKISTGFVTGDCFAAEFDSLGNALWAKPIGGRRPGNGTDGGSINCSLIATDNEGNSIIGGVYINCDLRIESTYLPPSDYEVGTPDMWFAKLDTMGALKWANNAGSINPDFLNAITTDDAGNIYLTGGYGDECVFDKDTVMCPQTAPIYLFAAKYDGNSSLKWIRALGGTTGAIGSGITINQNDEPIVVGSFTDPSLNVGLSTIFNHSYVNGFVAKMGGPTAVNQNANGIFKIDVYPNPVSDKINITLIEYATFDRFALLNMQGQLVCSGPFGASRQQTLFLPDLPNGIYFLRLAGPENSVSKKISIHQN